GLCAPRRPTPPPSPYPTLFRSRAQYPALHSLAVLVDRAVRDRRSLLAAGGVAADAPAKYRGVRRRAGPGIARAVRTRARCVDRRSEEHTSELQSRENLVCRLLL